jgi:glycosyltransferase involved in cell wall biosynthesis
LKVVINAVSAKLGGGATYISNLLRHVSLLARDSHFLVFLPPETIETLHGLPDNIRLMPTRVGYGRWWKRMWWEQVTLRRVLRNEKPDILFSAANFGMLQCLVPQVLLIQNALYFSSAFQELFFPKCSLRRRAGFLLRRWLVCESVRGADLVVIPTQAALDDLRRFVQVPQARALVNPYGGKIPAAGADPARGGRGAHRLGESGPVRLLYVSLYFEHKNLATLLKAMPVLNSQGSPKFKLTTTLDPASEVHASWTITGPTDLALARRSDIRDSLEVVGLLGQAETQELYGRADIFVFPSLAESFGFPMVEAMAHGLPIVAADTPVNREICQDAAVYSSPLDWDDLAAKIRRVATDDVLRSRLSAAGPPRVATSFRWSEHVGRILGSFRRVLAESRVGAPRPSGGTQADRRL